MRKRLAHVLPLALGIAACGEEPLAPERIAVPEAPSMQAERGVGIALDDLTVVTVPLVGEVDRLDIDQVVINEIILGEVVGGVVGLEVIGTVTGTLEVAGTDVVNEQFTSTLSVTPGAGGCSIANVDLGPLDIGALGLVTLDVPAAQVEGRGSGAVGTLLCTLSSLVNGVVGGATRGVQGVVNAINRRI
jgi:hypothetical protein